ncbi:hypothetical protein BDZ85DRAFT_294841 [Elsinoe ampelina]|uniref:Uncharacterized protein n=1 Tax=Elsinoe ampelina TaxID=302913 RepID=A0A6A6GH66_9PEZI|nr:hypothetical protein BDZ85DRAFT_294841 [Elsinoe ampelina]
MGNRILVARQWRFPKVVIAFFGVELCLTVAALALFGIADPNLYRTKLWLDGALNGFNSHPEQVLYAYANHEKPVIPLVWSQLITTFNLVISILSTFLLLVKSVMFVMKTWVPLLSLLMHMILTALYAFSTYAQLSSDKSDPFGRIQNGPPWYITKSCDVVHDKHNYGYCRQAKASLGVTVAMVGILFIQIILASLSIVPSTMEKQLRGHHDDEDSDDEHQHGEVVMYAPEKPVENPFYSPQTPSQAHPYSPLPQKQPIHYQQETDYEMANLATKAHLESQRQSQQFPSTYTSPPHLSTNPQPTPQPLQSHAPSRPTSHVPHSFTTNLLHQYIQRSPARAITTSEPTPPFSREDATSRPASTIFDPPPTAATAAAAAAAAPTPRTAAFNRLVGRSATNAEKAPPRPKPSKRGLSFSSTNGKGENLEKQQQQHPKETRKQRKERAAREKEAERKRQVERYFALQKAGPPGTRWEGAWEGLASPQVTTAGDQGRVQGQGGGGDEGRGYFVGRGRGQGQGRGQGRGQGYAQGGYGQERVTAQEYITGRPEGEVRGCGQRGGLPFRERYGS